jgi:hypothetical protein
MKHQIVRVRHDLRRRSLVVSRVGYISPGMLRIGLKSENLAQFISLAPDDHIKLFVPGDDDRIEKRDYTPRHYDPKAGELSIDFAVHDAGHLRNMLAATEMGAIIHPPVPAFYAHPRTIADLVDHALGRALDCFGLDMPNMSRWGEEAPEMETGEDRAQLVTLAS